MQKHSLEQYRLFPYIAWTIVIAFALFVYTLTLTLQEAKTELASNVARLQAIDLEQPLNITELEH